MATEKQLRSTAQEFITIMDLTDGPEGNKKPLVLTDVMEEQNININDILE